MPDVVLSFECPEPSAAVWRQLLSGRGLCALGSLAEKETGDTYSIETAAGDVFRGTVAMHAPESELVLEIENMSGSRIRLVTHGVEGGSAKTRLEFSLVAVGLHHDEVDSFDYRWRHQLRDLFPGCNETHEAPASPFCDPDS